MMRPRSRLARYGLRNFLAMSLLASVMVVALSHAQSEVAQQLTPGSAATTESGRPPLEVIDPGPNLPGIPLAIKLSLALIALAIVAALVALIAKRAGRTPSLVTSAHSSLFVARVRMEELQNLPKETSLAEIGTRISLILRHYLADSQSENALYQTHEEFNASERRLERLPMEPRQEVTLFLQELADVQYASPASDPGHAVALITKGSATLETISRSTRQEAPTHA